MNIYFLHENWPFWEKSRKINFTDEINKKIETFM
jgi:hypothetical protein